MQLLPCHDDGRPFVESMLWSACKQPHALAHAQPASMHDAAKHGHNIQSDALLISLYVLGQLRGPTTSHVEHIMQHRYAGHACITPYQGFSDAQNRQLLALCAATNVNPKSSLTFPALRRAHA